MIVINIVAVIIAATVSVLSYPEDVEHRNWLVVFTINFVQGLLLVTSVIIMRRKIKQTNFAQPNEKLVTIHVINFTLIVLVAFSLALLQILGVG